MPARFRNQKNESFGFGSKSNPNEFSNATMSKLTKSFQNISLPTIKQALDTGKFNLSSKKLTEIPEFIFDINAEIPQGIRDLDPDYMWYNSQIITQINLAYNNLTSISCKISQIQDLTHLDLTDNLLTELPDEFHMFKNLTTINFSHNKIRKLPKSLTEACPTLSYLHLQQNEISGNLTVPDLPHARELNLSGNKLHSVTIQSAPSLIKLNITDNQLEHFCIEHAPKLSELALERNSLKSVQGTENLGSVVMMYLDQNRLEHLPMGLDQMKNLSKLTICNNRIANLPNPLMGSLPESLNTLDLSENRLQELPADITFFHRLSRLDISSNCLKDLPLELCLLENLQTLCIDNNPLRTMRKILGKSTIEVLSYLKTRMPVEKLESVQETIPNSTRETSNTKSFNFSQITLQDKQLTSVSQVFEHYPELDPSQVKSLDLSKNRITDLSSIELFTNLVDLNLFRNNLTDSSFANFSISSNKLRSINLSQNQLKLESSNVFSCFSSAKTVLEIFVVNTNRVERIEVDEFIQFSKLHTLDLGCNNIGQVPPRLGLFRNQLMTLVLDQNPFRIPRLNVLQQGTAAVLEYMFNRIPQ